MDSVNYWRERAEAAEARNVGDLRAVLDSPPAAPAATEEG